MSDSFTKLFAQMLDSTVWGEPPATRAVWITMLLMADAKGRVLASVPGLARRAVVSIAETQTALECFLSPDPFSRTPDNEGRRIEVIDGGWQLLNYAKFRERRSAADRADYQREWDRSNRNDRPNAASRKPSEHPTAPDSPRQPPTHPDEIRPKQIADVDVEQEQDQRHLPGAIAGAIDSVPEATASPPVFTLPTTKGVEVPITQAQVDTWAEAYPGVDVLAELRKARAWLISNPKRGKTKAGMARFCNLWLERAQNDGGGLQRLGQRPRAGPSVHAESKTGAFLRALNEAIDQSESRDGALVSASSGEGYRQLGGPRA